MSMRSALRGPAHQLAVRMRINNCTHGYNINNYYPINRPAMHHAPATARAPRVCTLVPFIFLRKSDCLGCAVLLCLVCLLDLACFFLPSFSSLIKHVYQYVLHAHVHVHVHVYTFLFHTITNLLQYQKKRSCSRCQW